MKSVRKIENVHIFLWLLKDTCWVMDYQKLGVFMILPTICVAFFITWHTRKIITELFHNLAVCCWVCANSVWMIGEFFYDDTTRPYATVFFVTGVIIMTIYYTFLHKKYYQPAVELETAELVKTPSAKKPVSLEPTE
jgi:hypothetical protein